MGQMFRRLLEMHGLDVGGIAGSIPAASATLPLTSDRRIPRAVRRGPHTAVLSASFIWAEAKLDRLTASAAK
jgi:hypothetical protein